jgi:hypothetical protein
VLHLNNACVEILHTLVHYANTLLALALTQQALIQNHAVVMEHVGQLINAHVRLDTLEHNVAHGTAITLPITQQMYVLPMVLA